MPFGGPILTTPSISVFLFLAGLPSSPPSNPLLRVLGFSYCGPVVGAYLFFDGPATGCGAARWNGDSFNFRRSAENRSGIGGARAELASRRQTIMFSSDDNRSLHVIVCFYRKGRNRCWAIRPQCGGKGWQTDLSVIMDLITCSIHAVSYQSKSRNIHSHYFYRIWRTHGNTSGFQGRVKARTTSTKANLKFRAHHKPLTSDTEHQREIFMHKLQHFLTPSQDELQVTIDRH